MLTGYKAYRRTNTGMGAWFLHAFIEVCKEYSMEDHLEEMLITVKGKVAHDEQFQTRDGKKQMPCTWSTLTRRLFLM